MRTSQWLFLTIVLSIGLWAGCGQQPRIQRENLRLIDSLRTAISTKRTDWLEQNAKLVEKRFAAGTLSTEERDVLVRVIDEARGGNWAEAQTEILALAKAQTPSAEDLEWLRSRQETHETEKK